MDYYIINNQLIEPCNELYYEEKSENVKLSQPVNTEELEIIKTVSIPDPKSIIPPDGLGTLHTYTVWDKIKWGAGCRKLLNFAKDKDSISDSCGIVTYGKFFCGATTTTLGNVGDLLLIIQDNKIIYPVIVADTKNQYDKGCTKWGHQGGKCMVEFEILSSHRKSLYGSSGGYISDNLNKPICKVINLGSVYGDAYYYYTNPEQAAIDNDLSGYTLLITPYEGKQI